MTERCDGRYPVGHKRAEPFEVTYRCELHAQHQGPCGPALKHYHAKLGPVLDEVADVTDEQWRYLEERARERTAAAIRAWSMADPAPWWPGEHTIAGLEP